jgi:hypothetical protein
MPLIAKLLTLTRPVLVGVGAIIAAFVAGYVYLESEVGLLADNTMRDIVKMRVFGTKLYGKSCDEASYRIEVPPYRPSNRATEVVLHPVAGREQDCPSFTMIIDRTSGELWRID